MMNARKLTIANLELRIGILEDRLATTPMTKGSPGALERSMIDLHIEKLKQELLEERNSYREVMRMIGPG